MYPPWLFYGPGCQTHLTLQKQRASSVTDSRPDLLCQSHLHIWETGGLHAIAFEYPEKQEADLSYIIWVPFVPFRFVLCCVSLTRCFINTFLRIVLPVNQVEGFFGKAFIDPYLAYKLGNVLVSMRTAQHFKSQDAWFVYHAFFLTRRGGRLPEFNQRTMNLWFSWCELLALVQQWSCTGCAMQEHGPVQYQCAQLLPGWGPTTCVCERDLFLNVMFLFCRVFSEPFCDC